MKTFIKLNYGGKMEYIIVANRLPFTIKKDLSFEKSPGGLVSGLLTFLKKKRNKTI